MCGCMCLQCAPLTPELHSFNFFFFSGPKRMTTSVHLYYFWQRSHYLCSHNHRCSLLHSGLLLVTLHDFTTVCLIVSSHVFPNLFVIGSHVFFFWSNHIRDIVFTGFHLAMTVTFIELPDGTRETS